MKRLTVLAAAFATATTTFAAFAQEAPVNPTGALAVGPVAETPVETAPAVVPAIASVPIAVDDQGHFGSFSVAEQVPASASIGAIEKFVTVKTASATAAKKPDRAIEKPEPKKAAAKVEQPKKVARERERPVADKVAKKTRDKIVKEKPEEVELSADVPTPQWRPELVATARKASVLASTEETESAEKSVSTEGAKDLIVAVKNSAGEKAAALGAGGKGKYREIVARYATAYGVPVSLAHAVIAIESNYRADARGSAGEVGLMQIKPATARMMGFSGSAKELFHPENNIKYGLKYLGKARELGGGTTCGTILRYNAGHGAKRMNPVSAAYCSKVKRHLGTA